MQIQKTNGIQNLKSNSNPITSVSVAQPQDRSKK